MAKEMSQVDKELGDMEKQVDLFRRERDRWVERLRAREIQIADMITEEEAKTDEIKEMIMHCEQQDYRLKKAKHMYEERIKDKYLYKGNGDLKDKLDLFVMDYMRKNKLYVEVLNVAHGLYIIGGGYSVRA